MYSVEVVQPSEERAAWLAELEDQHPPARTDDSGELRDSRAGIADVPDAEGNACHFERLRSIRKSRDIGDLEPQTLAVSRPLFPGQIDHLGHKVGPRDHSRLSHGVPKCDGQITGPGRAIENAISRPDAGPSHHSTPPEMMDPERQDVVGTVVTAGDRAEHLVDCSRVGARARSCLRRNRFSHRTGPSQSVTRLSRSRLRSAASTRQLIAG